MKKNLYLFLLLFFSVSAFSQTTSLKGIIVSSSTNLPIPGISIQLQKSELSTISEFDGSFYFEGISQGTDLLVVSSPDINTSEVSVDIIEGQINDVGAIRVSENVRNLFAEGSLIFIDEEDISDDTDKSDYNVSALMTASNDVYISSTSWNFSAVRFRQRGYGYRYSNMYINGVNFNDPIRGGFSYGMIGGLNDATRNKDVVNGLNPSTFTFGQIGGSGNINVNAANFSRGGKTGLAYTNRSYKVRGTTLVSTGVMKNGWAITGSVAYRWADEGFIEGTFYNSLGYLLAVSKEINSKHSISFTTIGAPTQRAQQSPNFQETVDLIGSTYYNAYWGWQDGGKRNSRIVTVFEPLAVLSHLFQINKDTKLTTGLGFKHTSYASTRLNWFNGANPAPDYYRNLPSYQQDPDVKEFYTQIWQSRDPEVTQVNWMELYNANKNNPDGNAVYMVEERHNNLLFYTFNSVLNTKLNKRISLTAGLNANITKGMHYKTMSDLLGAKSFIDIDQFAQRDKPKDENIWQNDMNNPNREIGKGDRFGYDYETHINSVNLWGQNAHRYRKWDVHYGLKGTYTSFYRYGNMMNGRAPENSYGKGETHTFFDYSSKLGLTYKLSGRHIFSGNVSYLTMAPLPFNAYISARTRDDVVLDLQSEKIFTVDLKYNLSTPVFRGSISVFQTNFYDQAELHSYYSDNDGNFVNQALTKVNKMHRGIEAGVKAKINTNVTLTLAGTIAEYTYSSNPTGVVSYENDNLFKEPETVFMKGLFIGGTPQTAGTFGIQYFYNYWFVNLDLNGFDRTYVDAAPSRRTQSFIDRLIADNHEDDMQEAMSQEKFIGGYTLDFSIGKSFRLDSKHSLNINLQFKNILNNTDLKTGGFEQGRFDFKTYNLDKFPNKYYWAQGFNCFIMASLRF